MSSGATSFPPPVRPTLPIVPKDDSDQEGASLPETPSRRRNGDKNQPVSPATTARDSGPQNDESLETLSIHEQLVDEAIKRTPDTARILDLSDDEKESAYLQSEHGKALQERLQNLVAAFRARSTQAKQMVMQPLPHEPRPEQAPPPPKAVEAEEKKAKPIENGKPPTPKKEEKKPAPPSTKVIEPPPLVTIPVGKFKIPVPDVFFRIPRPESFDSHSRKYLAWLTLLSIALVYNAITIPYRAAFNERDDPYWYVWLIVDYSCDLLYIIDVAIWKPSIITFVNGIQTNDKKEITRQYVKSGTFRLDILSLVPLDLFYLVDQVGINPLLRLPRLLKINAYWELLDRIDQIVTNPYYFRVLRSVGYMMYLIHANACLFYYLSFLEDFDTTESFVFNANRPPCNDHTILAKEPKPHKCTFPGDYNAYIFSFFFSVSMVTIIGNLHFPTKVWQIVYSAVLWFVGVFIFATLVGQIRDVLKAMTRQEDEFYEIMDAIVEHMHTLKIPKELQDRVRTWLLYNWEQQKTIDERHLLDGLPTKLRTDLAMEVHYSTVQKVKLFEDVDKKVLEELLLRLRPSVYLPGDFICKKGEIGKEMYIIKSGILEVVLPDGRVAVTLGPGSVFGEISLLALAGGNRRTADVKSKGFSNLYVLSKADLNSVMKDYPETLEALRQKAHDLMNKGKPPPEKPPTPPPIEVIPTRPPTPEMVRVALHILKPDSEIRRRMSHSAVELSALDDFTDTEDPEIAMATVHMSNSDRAATPEPVDDVPRPGGSKDHEAGHSKGHRHRSRANAPAESSDSGDDGRSQRDSRVKLRQRKVSRSSNKSGRAGDSKTTSAAGGSAPITATKTGSMTSLKRRFFSTPKVQPINNTPVAVAPDVSGSLASISDHDFMDLTDAYGGATVSSPDSGRDLNTNDTL